MQFIQSGVTRHAKWELVRREIGAREHLVLKVNKKNVDRKGEMVRHAQENGEVVDLSRVLQAGSCGKFLNESFCSQPPMEEDSRKPAMHTEREIMILCTRQKWPHVRSNITNVRMAAPTVNDAKL
jgi:hypothetical protein